MVAEDQSTPMPDKDDPWTKEVGEEDGGGSPAEFVESEHNEPGSQAPPSGAAVPGPEERTDGEDG